MEACSQAHLIYSPGIRVAKFTSHIALIIEATGLMSLIALTIEVTSLMSRSVCGRLRYQCEWVKKVVIAQFSPLMWFCVAFQRAGQCVVLPVFVAAEEAGSGWPHHHLHHPPAQRQAV